MAHISGLVAAKQAPSPFLYSDIVTTTTHKTLQGARGGMIFYRKGVRSVDKKGNKTMYDLEQKINDAVFPGHQGGPHMNNIAGIAVALGIAKTPEFHDYSRRCVENSRAIDSGLKNRGYSTLTDGTDNHMVIFSLKHKGIDGGRADAVLDEVNISLSKQSLVGDRSAVLPSGLRVGSPSLTSRGFGPAEFDKVVEYIDRGVDLAVQIQKECGAKKLSLFKKHLNSIKGTDERIKSLKQEIHDYCGSFEFVPWGH